MPFARANLYRLIDDAAQSREPILITGQRANAILLSKEDGASIQETLHLLSVRGMRESIVEGLNTPTGERFRKLDW